jgi:UDP-glucose 4-epimerase
MRILVVGGAGFLGSHVVDRLLAEGHAVDVLDDLSTGSLANLSSARAEHVGAVKFHNVDVRAPELSDLVAHLHPDVAIHLAVPTAGPARSVLADALGGTGNVLEAAARAGTTKVVVGLHGTTYYGHLSLRELPAKEGAFGSARSAATVAHRAVADLLALYRDRHAVEYTGLAFGSVYGTRQRPERSVVSAFVAARHAGRPALIDGDGHQTRDFVAVDDAVDAVVRATTRGTGLVVNVGTGVQTSINDLHELVCGTPLDSAEHRPALPDEIPRFALSPVRARIHLAWAPWTSLNEGVSSLLVASTPPAPAPVTSDASAAADD